MINTPEAAARYVLRNCPDLTFEKPLLGGHPCWQYRGHDGPDALWAAAKDLLNRDRFCPAESFLLSGETRKTVREAAEHLITRFERSSL